MSKISDLAKTFEQTSRTEAASIEQQTKADLETLRKNINEALKQSEQKITADINARQLRMSKAVFKPYLWSLLGISAAGLIVIAGLFIAIWSVKNELDDLKQQRAEAERTLDLLETKTKGLTLENCPVENSKATRVCVATEKRMMKALTHLGERLAELEQENTSLAQQLASLAAELERQSEIQQRQSEILNQLAKR
ncbi:MbeB family mobilization protein [Neisseria gonorrhoeae]|uniref:MbeB family mobilization protein n=47 Tax=cellular organisms TaxID=131567 RepID=A0ABD5JP26_9ACTN|nr:MULTISPECIES: MbeB family mobilization protein [Bacteria]ECM0836740.1 cryptic plasmid protein B [Salmonella enterica]EDN4650925.1 cryptic plasmid protein B [Salmonella enterica subsp. enterica serovar Hadar]EDP9523679.1 cryptic plasmid protein B [Salmonella enterica subsp. enterica serovar Saintpaul]EFQ0773182.1 cryptic plasmid protein B [Shigella flexneri]EGY7790794.1 cryptic plasmid protein B [Escherichia coli]ELZ4287994.1 cryptic plasmid protein B [Campylobacter upsaliensis]KLS42381.1 